MADKEANNPAKGHTVVAFLIFPTRHNSFNVDSLKGQAITKQLRYVCVCCVCGWVGVVLYVFLSCGHVYVSVSVCLYLYACNTTQNVHSVVLPCREVVNELQAKIGTKMFEAALSGKILESENFLDNEDRVKLKRCIFASQVHISVMCICNIVRDVPTVVGSDRHRPPLTITQVK